MTSLQQRKYTYIIQDEQGKESIVSFQYEHQICNWISMELNINGKYYTIVKEIK